MLVRYTAAGSLLRCLSCRAKSSSSVEEALQAAAASLSICLPLEEEKRLADTLRKNWFSNGSDLSALDDVREQLMI